MNPYASPSEVAPAASTGADLSSIPPRPRVPSSKARRILFPTSYGAAIFASIWCAISGSFFYAAMVGKVKGPPTTVILVLAFTFCMFDVGFFMLIGPIIGRRRRERAFREGFATRAEVVSFEGTRDKSGRVIGKRLAWRGVDVTGRTFEGSLFADVADFPMPEYGPGMPIVVLLDPKTRVSTIWLE